MAEHSTRGEITVFGNEHTVDFTELDYYCCEFEERYAYDGMTDAEYQEAWEMTELWYPYTNVPHHLEVELPAAGVRDRRLRSEMLWYQADTLIELREAREPRRRRAPKPWERRKKRNKQRMRRLCRKFPARKMDPAAFEAVPPVLDLYPFEFDLEGVPSQEELSFEETYTAWLDSQESLA